MKIPISFFLCILMIFSQAQESKYHEFGWKQKYGIVDDKGNEIVAPTYLWTVYTLHHQSPFIALNSHENGGLIINKINGKIEKFDLMYDTYLLNLNGEEYFYAYNTTDSYLINNLDLEKRIRLPKKYQKVQLEEEFLIGNLTENNGDILSKKDFKIFKENIPMTDFSSYKTVDRKIIYIANQKNTTLFLDENLNQLFSSKKSLKGFEEIQKFLATKNIKINEEPYPITETMVGAGPDYPYIDAKMDGEYVVYNIYQSRNDFQKFFRFKRKNFRLSNDSYNNKVELSTRKENKVITHLMFYTDVNTKTIFLPKKYWRDIELELLTE